MTIRLNGSTSGYTEIDAPATGGNNTLVLPTGNGSADQALVTNGSGTLSFADRGRMVQGTAQNSTSGTSIDFTSIPSWVKRVTVMLNGVSTNGSSQLQFQLGHAGGFEASGYNGGASYSTLFTANSTGFLYADTSSANASYVRFGIFIFCNVTGNTWVESHTSAAPSAGTFMGAGFKTLSGTLDRVRITTVNGTDTFDAGSINILYEG